MSETRLNEQKLYYQMVITIWEGFCELHRDLYDLACEEYLTLLSSDIDKLETMLPKKEEIISRVSLIEKDRADLISRINSSNVFDLKIERVNDLLKAFDAIDSQASIPALRNLNALLIDIIQKIQEQNKKNQIFLNKAMISIREIKQGFSGKKTYTTYGADGMTRALGR